MDMRLKDRVAIVTGGGAGIGEATCMRFAQEGAKIVVADMDMAGAQRVADAIKAKGGHAVPFKVDVRLAADVANMVGAAIKDFGTLDILVNNAGINRDAIAKRMTEEQWNIVLDVNLKGTFLCCQAASVPMMEKKYGRIINTSSIGSLGNIGQANYSASKAGVIGLTKTLALELAKIQYQRELRRARGHEHPDDGRHTAGHRRQVQGGHPAEAFRGAGGDSKRPCVLRQRGCELHNGAGPVRGRRDKRRNLRREPWPELSISASTFRGEGSTERPLGMHGEGPEAGSGRWRPTTRTARPWPFLRPSGASGRASPGS